MKSRFKVPSDTILKRAWIAGQKRLRELELANGAAGDNWMSIDELWKKKNPAHTLAAMRELVWVLLRESK